jgi:hypothetical protein
MHVKQIAIKNLWWVKKVLCHMLMYTSFLSIELYLITCSGYAIFLQFKDNKK